MARDRRAVEQPGIISSAYSQFHSYSLGNQLLAFVQCAERRIPSGPIATFMGWKVKGRYVRKGEKAIVLCMPVTCKRKPADQPADTSGPDADQQPETFTRFGYRPNWFVLSQTDGQTVEPPPMPDWNQTRAFDALAVIEEPFTMTDGNCQGQLMRFPTRTPAKWQNTYADSSASVSRITNLTRFVLACCQ
jgi:hypothetical protein